MTAQKGKYRRKTPDPSAIAGEPPPPKDGNHASMSTHFAFASPTSPPSDWQWLPGYTSITRSITMKSGTMIPVPLLWWDARAVVVEGSADADRLDHVLREIDGRDRGLRCRRYTDPTTLRQPGNGGDFGRIRIWAPDYGGTTIGPFKSVFASVQIEPREHCLDPDSAEQREADLKTPRLARPIAHWLWWWYVGTSPVNREFKQDVWGIPNELGQIETAYRGTAKIAQVLENGKTALRMKVDLSKAAPIRGTELGDAQHPTWTLRTVSHRSWRGDDSENWAEVKALERIPEGFFGDAVSEDVFRVGAGTEIERQLTSVRFKPRRWQFLPNYVGIVKLWDDKGAARDPQAALRKV